MKDIIRWLAASRYRSAIATAGLAGTPFFMMFSAALVVMATLRGSLREGLTLAGIATLILAAVMLLVKGPVTLALVNALLHWLPAAALAAVLLKTRSLSLCLQLLTVIGLLAVGVFWLLVAEPTSWWVPVITETYAPLTAQLWPNLDPAELIPAVARLMPGMQAAGWVFAIALALLAGRWFHAILDKPGAFGDEFRVIRLGKIVGGVAAGVFIAAGLTAWPLLQNLVLVLITAFLLQGLALSHWLVKQRGLKVGWLVGLYVMLVFAAPWSLVLVASAGFLDNWLAIRTANAATN